MSNIEFSKPKPTDTTATALDRQVEVTIHMDIEPHPTGRMNDDDLSTIISTSERIPYIVGDLSELSITPESACSLPIVSPSRFPSRSESQ